MDAPGAQTPPAESRTTLEERYRAALAEVERLSTPDDHGTGERTARLAGLALWQLEAERLRGLLDATLDTSDAAALNTTNAAKLDTAEAATPEGSSRAG